MNNIDYKTNIEYTIVNGLRGNNNILSFYFVFYVYYNAVNTAFHRGLGELYFYTKGTGIRYEEVVT